MIKTLNVTILFVTYFIVPIFSTFTNSELTVLILISEETNINIFLSPGMYTGYNTLNMALVVPESGQVIACEIDDE
jgi:predicted O-methyltransferase YrrM